MTEFVYTELSAKVEASKARKRRVSISGVLKKLGVSRTGYRAFLQHKTSMRDIRKFEIKKLIQKIYDKSKQNYGAPKITKELRRAGETISERTVGKYMREMGIRAQWCKPRIATTRNSDFSDKLHNILDENFNPDRPNAVWCTDITYIWTQSGFVYLTSIMDLFSRKIISWTLSGSMDVSFVIETVEKAKKTRDISKPLILHSDRGSQYVSKAYRKATENFQLSYSKKGYPYDNACIESFHSLIKREWLNRFSIINEEHAHKLVFDYIETFYNTVRIHSHCGFMSPNTFEDMHDDTLT